MYFRNIKDAGNYSLIYDWSLRFLFNQYHLKFIKNEESTLEILDISAEAMKTFLQFIYKDDVEVEDIDQNLLIAADK